MTNGYEGRTRPIFTIFGKLLKKEREFFENAILVLAIALFIRCAKVSKSNAFAYFSILKLAYAALK